MIPRREADGDYGFYVPEEGDSMRNESGRTWLSVDVLAFVQVPGSNSYYPALALWRRPRAPHKGELALPGAVLDASRGETVEDTAHRVLIERLGAVDHGPIVPVTFVSDAHRDERGHTVSNVVATSAIVENSDHLWTVSGGLKGVPLPFGHGEIIRDACDKLAMRLLVEPEVARALLPGTFTVNNAARLLAQLRRFSGKTADTRALRKQVERCDLFEVTGGTIQQGKGRPSNLLRVAAD